MSNEGFQHEMLKCYLSSLHIIALCVDSQGYSESIGRGRAKPGEATPPNNSGHPEMHVMLLVVWCLGFFGFRREAGFTAPPLGKDFNAGVHLSLQDIALDSHSSPSRVRVKIKCSKIDPFRQ